MNLRTSLDHKEEQLNNLKDTSSSAHTGALNVADYEIKDIDNEKIDYLTQMLIQKQGKIDTLLADYNILKIQFDKLQVFICVFTFIPDISKYTGKSSLVILLEDIKMINSLKQDLNPLHTFTLSSVFLHQYFPMYSGFISHVAGKADGTTGIGT